MTFKIVMGIYPNARGFGYAVFRKATKPILCGVVTIKPVCNKKNLERIQKLIDHFNPEQLIIEDVLSSKSKSKRIKRLINKLNKKYKSNDISVYRYSRSAIQDVFSNFGALTKSEIATVIVKWLPEYESKLPKVRKLGNPEEYNQGMFDAMSLVLLHYYVS